MLSSKLPVILLVLLKFHMLSGCSPDKKDSASPPQYDLNNPVEFKLPDGLSEISGISYYPKDSSVFAIIDEDGLLFKIYLNGSEIIKKWRFDKNRDFEDVVLHDSAFYVLISNGEIETLKFVGDSIIAHKSEFTDAGKKKNEFETLYYDTSLGLVIMCKECEDDKKKIVTTWGYSPDSMSYNLDLFSIDVQDIAKKNGEDKIHFKPSAAAINPITNELYILSAVNELLVVADRNGRVKDVYPLDPVTFNQPEGITFTPWGDLLISNEKGEKGSAAILIFKSKKKG